MIDRPNVLVVTMDQWRGECLSVLDHPVVSTPALDSLATDGVVFTHHFAQAVPCGPSRASLWTGLYLHNHRSVFNGTPLADGLPNLARDARALGYDPILFGYTDTSVDPATVVDPDDPRLFSYEGVLPGFREGLHLREDRMPWAEWLRAKGYDVPEPIEPWLVPIAGYPGAEGRGATWPPAPFAAEHTETAFLTDAVIDHLDQASEPWFVHLAYIRPHPPFIVPEPYNDLVDPAEVPDRSWLGSVAAEAASHPLVEKIIGFDPAPEDDGERRQLAATYFAMMREVDDQFGRVLGWLDERGQSDHTIVVVTSDHGEQLGDHGMLGKLSFFEPSFRIPLIVRAPMCPGGAGRMVSAFTENVDIRPTVLDLLGASPARRCDGRSLRRFLEGAEPDDWRDAAHWEFDYRVFGSAAGRVELDGAWFCVLRDSEGAYVHGGELPALFFDIVEDPGWLADRPADPRIVQYAQRMLTWRMRSSDDTLADQLITPRGVRDLGVRRRVEPSHPDR